MQTSITIMCDACPARQSWDVTGEIRDLENWKGACRAELTMLGWLIDRFGATCDSCMHGLAHWVAVATSPVARN